MFEEDSKPEPETRRPTEMWDRVKVTLCLSIVLALLTGDFHSSHNAGWKYSLDATLAHYWWLGALISIELYRQVHYLMAETFGEYNEFCTRNLGAAVRTATKDMNDWTKFRLVRAGKWIAVIAMVGVVAGASSNQAPLTALLTLPRAIWHQLPMVMQILAYVLLGVSQFAAIFWFMSRGGIEVYNPGDIRTRFDDVWGQDHVVSKVKENIIFLQKPEEIESRGGHVPSGILLWGPPGTGKTLMAEAVAGETGKPYVFVDPGAFINMFMGVGILKVKGLFRRLRKLALKHGGVVVFLDEADSLGSRGGLQPAAAGATGGAFANTGCHGMSYMEQVTQNMLMHGEGHSSEPARRGMRSKMYFGGSGDTGTLQALLTELSGLTKPRGFWNRTVRRALGMQPRKPPKYRILVMMATNMPQSLDEALLRPGRIDRMYKVGYPTKKGRIRTYRGYFDRVQNELTEEHIDKIATMTPYATGATIKDLVNESLINAIRNGRERVVWQDVIEAKHLKDLGPPEGVEYIERERHATAIHEACHAVAAYRQQNHLTIDIATIEKGADYLGLVASIPPEDQFSQWRSEYETDVVVALASLAGEKMFFAGDHSSGVMGDLNAATRIAAHMEAHWGMGSTIASHGALQNLGINSSAPSKGDEKVDATLGPRVEKKLAELLERAETLLRENRREVLSVAHALETHKTLSGDDIEAIIEGRQGPIVDGTPYAHPGFLVAAEAYHDQALKAHQDHDRIEMAMPAVYEAHVPSEAPISEGSTA